MEKMISIIIPAYNIQDYIGKCLDSVLNQTYKKLEIIVVDDGSKDQTLRIINEYAEKDSRIRVISKANGGVTSARFCGIEAAKGEYIGFVDGDDYVEPMMYECLMKNAEESGADISHCGYQMVFLNGRVDYYYNTNKKVLQDKQTGLRDLLQGQFVEPGLVNKLYKKSLFEKLIQNELMDFSIKINEDLLMNYYLFKEANKATYEDICFYRYVLRRNSAATSKINENKLRDPAKVLEIILQDVKYNDELLGIAWERLLRQYISLATMTEDKENEVITLCKREAQEKLKTKISNIPKQAAISKKVLYMAKVAVYCPKLYEIVHALYSKLRGHDKKYKVD